MRQEEFRDEIFAATVMHADGQVGEVFRGLLTKAKSGRVDAAKLVLELTGRYSVGPDQPPSTVVVQIGDGLPRPMPHYEVDGVVEDEAEDG